MPTYIYIYSTLHVFGFDYFKILIKIIKHFLFSIFDNLGSSKERDLESFVGGVL